MGRRCNSKGRNVTATGPLEGCQYLDEALVNTTLQHILSSRPNLKIVPDDWLHRHTNQEDLPCDSQNSLQADTDDCNRFSITMHNTVGMKISYIDYRTNEA
jgi:hypothetical protein